MDNIKPNIVTALVNTRMPGYTHDNLALSSPISVGFHGKQETLSAAAGDISDAVVIAMEEIGGHSDDLIFDDS